MIAIFVYDHNLIN